MKVSVTIKNLLRYESAGGVLTSGTFPPDSMEAADPAAEELLVAYREYYDAQVRFEQALQTAKEKIHEQG